MLSPAIKEKLKDRVTFEDEASENQFMADALNVYVELGSILSAPNTELFLHVDGAPARKVILPFQAPAPTPEA